jgi:transcriptional regulator with XRE-family HTH domain
MEGISMGAGKIIKQLLIERGISVKELAEKMGIIPQSMSNKIYRDTFSYDEMVKIADILNCDVKVITRDTGKEFS